MIKSGLAVKAGELGLCLACNKVKKIGCSGQGLCSNCYMKSHRNYRTYIRRSNLKKFNLTIKSFAELANKQDNKCAICNQVKKLYVDHCHNTGKVRGLLCNGCNSGIGHFYDDINLLEKVLDYLKKNKMEEV